MKQNKSTLILMSIALVACGLLLIYRGLLPSDSCQQFIATIKDKTIVAHDKYNKGQYYSLDISLVEKEEKYGVYLGTKDQADNDNVVNKITIGETYKFYVDPSVTKTTSGENLGIRIIESKGQIIYKENLNANFIGGGLLILFGVVAVTLPMYIDRKKKRHITAPTKNAG